MATSMYDDIAQALPDYEIGRELGRGQFGAVYAARHRQLARDVAIKQLLGERSDADAARFRREARILAQLDHAHVVTVYDYREWGSLRLLVMEMLTGGSFADRIERGINTETAVAGTMAAASGLHHVHQQGVLHRDVKPENLMLNGSGEIKVTDFGLARGEAADQTVVELTQAGTFFGTPAYAAPEQIAEALATGWPDVGPAADQYSLAAVLYTALSGELTHDPTGGFMALCERRMNDPARPLRDHAPDVPPALEAAVMTALARDPAERYDSVEAFAIAVGDAATEALGAGWIERSDLKIREAGPIRDAAGGSSAGHVHVGAAPRRSAWRWALAAAATAVVVVVILLYAFSRPAVQTSGSGPGGVSPRGTTPLSLTLTPTWQYKAGGKVFASPLVSSGLVVVGSSDHQVYGIDTATGAERWKFETGDGVRSSASTSKGVAFVGSDDGNVYAIGVNDGKQRWKSALGFQIVSSPAVSSGTVVVGANKLYALNETDGSTKWTFPTESNVLSSPAIADGVAYVGADNGMLYAVDLASGAKLWSADTGGAVHSSPVVRDGVVYVGTNGKTLLAFDAKSGVQKWHAEAGAEIKSTPAVADSLVFVGTGANKLTAIDRASGTEKWSFEARDKIDSSPLLVGTHVVVGSNDGYLYVVEQATGKLEGAYRVGDQVASSPRLAGSRVVVAAYDGTIYVLDGLAT